MQERRSGDETLKHRALLHTWNDPIIKELPSTIDPSETLSAQLEYFRRLRSYVGHELLLLPATACIVLNERGEVLMQCRVDNKMWSCPGGILDVGETVGENLAREVLEETGLSIERAELFGIFAGPEFRFTYPNGDQTAIVQFVFLARQYAGTPRADAESLEIRFFPLGALPSTITSTHRGFLHYLPDVLRGVRRLPIVI